MYNFVSIQGRNKVYFFIADPVILRKFFIPGSKRDENFDPLSRKILLIQNAWSLIQWKRPLIPILGLWSLIPPFFWPLIPDPIFLVTTLSIEQRLIPWHNSS